MTDWTKDTGSSGTMMIRDTGSTVEFWLKAGSSTFMHELPWGYTVNGVTDNSNYYDFSSGGSWQKIHAWTVSTDQTVTFRLMDTGTAGLGGPTNLSASINRATVPAAPTIPAISAITNTGWTANTNPGSNGGATIDLIQIGIGTSGATAPTIIYTANSAGIYTITGRVSGATYKTWARCHNSEGYGPWSGYVLTTTKNVPGTPSAPTISNPTQISCDVAFVAPADGGSPITAYQVAYGTVPGVQSTISADITGSPYAATLLLPGTTYYFYVRAKNIYGYGPWSASTTMKTIAGTRVNVAGVWHEAIPYVKVGGVWKLARPWAKNAGVWKETT